MRFEKIKSAVIAALSLAACGAGADTQVSGSWDANDAGGLRHADFSCSGSPVCTGVATIKLTAFAQCSNNFTFTNDVTVTGLDLSRPGPLSGTYTISRRACNTPNPDGTCTWAFAPEATWPFTGTWDGRSGTFSIASTKCNGSPLTRVGSFTAIVPGNSPVFPMTVTTSITPTVASASAQVQPRPEDAGRNLGIYVFAHAPSSRLKSALDKAASPLPALDGAGPTPCVLAQMNPQGQLTGVSASSMTPAVTGILSSQGQAVSILNNVSTPAVAGATFFVGYGATASAMLAAGLYQGAFTVPGEIQCSVSLASAPAPQSPGALTGLYWNASESGWGVHFTQRGANIFAAWYTYDGTGNPKWYVAPNCTMASSNAISGTCASPLYEVAAGAFFGTSFNPSLVHASQVGTLQVNFQSVNAASMSYAIGSQSRTIAIVRQIFPVAATSPPAVDYTDLWWNPNESGWGMAIAQQFGNIFLAWYVYDPSGKPFWYVAPSCTVSGSGCSGTLYRTTGPPFGPPLDPTKVQAFVVGSAIVSFVDANHGVLSYVVDGVEAKKTITRQLF